MGTEYYLVDKKNKTFYDLGKGNWYILAQDLDYIQDKDLLELFLLEDVYNVYDCDWRTKEDNDQLIEYIKTRIVPDIYNAFGNTPKEYLTVVPDSVDDITICKAKKYKCIGTRHNDIGSEEYNKDMAYLNRQLTPGNYPEHWYNPDNYKQYPEWELY